MTDKKVSALDTTTSAASVDLLHLVTGGTGAYKNEHITVPDFRGYVDVRDYGVLDGVLSTAAMQSAIDSGNPLFVPDITILTGPLTIDSNNTAIVGFSREFSKIVFVPTANSTCLDFNAGASTLDRCSLKNIWIHSDDTTYTKTAIALRDTTQFRMENVRVSGAGTDSTWSGATSVGVRVEGRDTGSLRDIRIAADSPIVLAQTANTSIVGVDHFNFHNLLLLANANPIIEVEDGTLLTNISFTGYQAWVKGTHGFYWNDTTQASNSYGISFQNVRTEQGTDATAYSFYIAYSASRVRTVEFVNCDLDSTKRGIFARQVNRLILDGVVYGSASLEALNIDDCQEMTLRDVGFTSGSTASIVGLVEKLGMGRVSAGSPVPDTAFYHQEGDNATDVNGNQQGLNIFGTSHWSASEAVADEGFLYLPASGVTGRTTGIIMVSAYSATGPVQEGGIIIGDATGGTILSGTANLALGNADTFLGYQHASVPFLRNRLGVEVDMVVHIIWM